MTEFHLFLSHELLEEVNSIDHYFQKFVEDHGNEYDIKKKYRKRKNDDLSFDKTTVDKIVDSKLLGKKGNVEVDEFLKGFSDYINSNNSIDKGQKEEMLATINGFKEEERILKSELKEFTVDNFQANTTRKENRLLRKTRRLVTRKGGDKNDFDRTENEKVKGKAEGVITIYDSKKIEDYKDDEGKPLSTTTLSKRGIHNEQELKFILLSADINLSAGKENTPEYGDEKYKRKDNFFGEVASRFDRRGDKNYKDRKLAKDTNKSDAGTLTGGQFTNIRVEKEDDMKALLGSKVEIPGYKNIYKNLYATFKNYIGEPVSNTSTLPDTAEKFFDMFRPGNECGDMDHFRQYRQFLQFNATYIGDFMLYGPEASTYIMQDMGIVGEDDMKGIKDKCTDELIAKNLAEVVKQLNQIINDPKTSAKDRATAQAILEDRDVLNNINNAGVNLGVASVLHFEKTSSDYFIINENGTAVIPEGSKRTGTESDGTQIYTTPDGRKLPIPKGFNVITKNQWIHSQIANVGIGTSFSMKIGDSASLNFAPGVSLRGVNASLGVTKTREGGDTGTQYPTRTAYLSGGVYGGSTWKMDFFKGGYVGGGTMLMLNKKKLQNDLDIHSAKYINISMGGNVSAAGVGVSMTISSVTDKMAGIEITGAAIENKYSEIFNTMYAEMKKGTFAFSQDGIASYLKDKFPKTSSGNLKDHARIIYGLMNTLGIHKDNFNAFSELGYSQYMGQLAHIYRLNFVNQNLEALKKITINEIGLQGGLLFNWKKAGGGQTPFGGFVLGMGIRGGTEYSRDDVSLRQAEYDRQKMIGAMEIGEGFSEGLIGNINESLAMRQFRDECNNTTVAVEKFTENGKNYIAIPYQLFNGVGLEVEKTQQELFYKHATIKSHTYESEASETETGATFESLIVPEGFGATRHKGTSIKGNSYNLMFLGTKKVSEDSNPAEKTEKSINDPLFVAVDKTKLKGEPEDYVNEKYRLKQNEIDAIKTDPEFSTIFSKYNIGFTEDGGAVVFTSLDGTAISELRPPFGSFHFRAIKNDQGVEVAQFINSETESGGANHTLSITYKKLDMVTEIEDAPSNTPESIGAVDRYSEKCTNEYKTFIDTNFKNGNNFNYKKLKALKKVSGKYTQSYTNFCINMDENKLDEARKNLTQVLKEHQLNNSGVQSFSDYDLFHICYLITGTDTCSSCSDSGNVTYNKPLQWTVLDNRSKLEQGKTGRFGKTFGLDVSLLNDLKNQSLRKVGNKDEKNHPYDISEHPNQYGMVFGYARKNQGAYDLKIADTPRFITNSDVLVTNSELKSKILARFLKNPIVRKDYLELLKDKGITDNNLDELAKGDKTTDSGYTFSPEVTFAIYPDCANETFMMDLKITKTTPNKHTETIPGELITNTAGSNLVPQYNSYLNIATVANRAQNLEAKVGGAATAQVQGLVKGVTSPEASGGIDGGVGDPNAGTVDYGNVNNQPTDVIYSNGYKLVYQTINGNINIVVFNSNGDPIHNTGPTGIPLSSMTNNSFFTNLPVEIQQDLQNYKNSVGTIIPPTPVNPTTPTYTTAWDNRTELKDKGLEQLINTPNQQTNFNTQKYLSTKTPSVPNPLSPQTNFNTTGGETVVEKVNKDTSKDNGGESNKKTADKDTEANNEVTVEIDELEDDDLFGD